MKALLPGLQEGVEKGLDHVVKLKRPRLLDLVKYHIKDYSKGLQQKKIKDLIDLIKNKCMVQDATVEAQPQQNPIA